MSDSSWPAIIGALMGVTLGFLLERLREFWASKVNKKKAAKAFYVEITQNIVRIGDSPDRMRKLLKDFQDVIENKTDSHPNLPNKGDLISNLYFQQYATEVQNFPRCLAVTVQSLYALFAAMKVEVRVISEMFDKYYSKNVTVGPTDISIFITKYIGIVESVIKLADEVRAELIYHYKVDSAIHSFYGTDEEKRLQKYIEAAKNNTILLLDKVSEELGITNKINIYLSIIHHPKLLRVNSNEFRIKDSIVV